MRDRPNDQQTERLTMPTRLKGLTLVKPRRHIDNRGYFTQLWSGEDATSLPANAAFVQENESLSTKKGTLRGLHYQAPPFAQAKLLRVVSGSVLDVVVDARTKSPTYGAWEAHEISAQNGLILFIPRGFLHGFVTLASNTCVNYKVDNFFAPQSAGTIIWNDPDLDIGWGVSAADVVLSDADRAAGRFGAWTSPFDGGVEI